MQVSNSLYQAYEDQLIPPSSSFDEFAQSHKAFQLRALRTGLLGMLLMPAVTFYAYKNFQSPRIQRGAALGFCCFYVFCVMPNQPPDEEMAFVRREGPKYLDVLIQKAPRSERIFREVLGIKPTEGTESFPSPRMALNRAETEPVWENGATWQADKEWPVESREIRDAESSYLSTDKSERPYVYDSLSAPHQGRDRSDY